MQYGSVSVVVPVPARGLELAHVRVDASRRLLNGTPIARSMVGCALETLDHQLVGGLYSQEVWGESFEEPAHAQAPKYLLLSLSLCLCVLFCMPNTCAQFKAIVSVRWC